MPTPGMNNTDTAVVQPSSKPKVAGSGKIVASKSKPRVMPPSEQPVAPSSTDGAAASATIGAPRSESARDEARTLYQDGQGLLGSHRWDDAAEKFREAISKDGSVAKYHGALGKVMMIQHKWLEAQAAYSAAVLLDLDNAEYKSQLKKARANR
jgi:hypothetical protein